ncbi:dTDP-D-glucose 4,6-dehydratase isoform X2 [Octopus vulgaris]|uniref:dTDP-D-glucose 4,6-dehydratase isoform X2 n=1 Tax=Octopus vulgaris TaxID=6645 RepID=A0AA36EZY1_OCTVU|nr:dTDP-D-glucose 4,6-dehydratase isoform X2 [Octopus vulgaris]
MEGVYNVLVNSLNTFQRRLFVTGGAGFVGSHLVIHLVEKYPEYYIVNYDKLNYCSSLKPLEHLHTKPNYKFIEGDICDPQTVYNALKKNNIDTILHLAAESHVDLSFENPLEFSLTNVYGSHVLINAAKELNIKLFFHMSTDEIYGGEHNELPVVMIRVNNVYGPHQYPDKVMSRFITQLLKDEKCTIHGDGQKVRNFIYVSDIVNAIDTLIHKGKHGEIYNIGSEFSISILELAKFLIKKTKNVTSEDDIAKYIEFVKDRVFNDNQYNINYSKILQFGWKTKEPWETGIEKTIEWYGQNLNNWSVETHVEN